MSDEEQVRRLLADARHDEPLPDDVAARLEGVLAGLRDEPADAPRVRTCPSAGELAARQRRRRVRGWVLAAAAVVAVGIGANQVDWSGLSSSGDDADGGSASYAQDEAGGTADLDGGAGRPQAEAPDALSSGPADWRSAELQLSSSGFGREVARFSAGEGERLLELARSQTTSGFAADSGALQYSAICSVGSVGRGYRVPVRYDGKRAWLVFRPAQGDSQVVDLYLCGGTQPTRSITLPVP